jgi:hypothetical protein
MGFEFLARVRKTSIILGLIVAPVLAIYFGPGFGGAWLAGIAWSLVNLHVLSELMKLIVTKQARSSTKIGIIMAAKFPLLYAAGFLLLKSGFFPVIGLLAGFLWPLFVTTMKALGRAFLRLDEQGTINIKNNVKVFLRSN